MNRRLISFLIAAIMLLLYAFPASAADSGSVIAAGSEACHAGDTVTVPITLQTDVVFGSIGITVEYDKDSFELISSSLAPEASSVMYTPSENTSVYPYVMSWFNSGSLKTVLNGTIGELTFMASKNAKSGRYPITLSCYRGRQGNYKDGVNVNYDIDRKSLGLKYEAGEIIIEPDSTEAPTEAPTPIVRPTTQPLVTESPTPTPHVHSFGEWETIQSPTIFSEGIEARFCGICGETESRSSEKLTMENEPGYGRVSFTVVDATDKTKPISSANIFISTGNDGEGTFTTNSEGKAVATLPVGTLKATVYAEGYLTRELTFAVSEGAQELPLIGISAKPLVEANLDHHEMTYDEIIDAGIDVSDPENNHVYKYEMKLTFVPEIDWVSVNFYWATPDNDPEHPKVIIPPEAPHSPSIPDPIVIYPPSNPDRPYIRFPRPDGVNIDVYPVSEEFYMIVYGEVGWLKEMHDVEMVVLNKSGTDTIENCVAELKLPDGLSLAAMNGEAQSLKRVIGHMDESSSEDLHWYVRGDKVGEYEIEASLDGTFMPFSEDFSYTYKSGTPIRVYAGTDMHMTVKVPGYTYYNDDYVMTIELENVSDRTIYNLRHAITGLTQSRVTTYSDGRIDKEVYVNEGDIGEISTDAFKPGDKMVVQLTANVMFRSKLMEYRKSQAADAVTGMMQLINAEKAFRTAADIAVDFGAALDKAATASSAAAPELCKALLKVVDVAKLSDRNAIAISAKLRRSVYYGMIMDIANGGDISKYSKTDLRACAILLDEAAKGYNAGDTFNAYQSVRTAIMSLPVRYALRDAAISTLEGSTAEIPCTFEIDYTNAPRYFGVENMSRYLRKLVTATMGEICAPTSFGLFSYSSAYDDAVRYVKAVEGSIASFAAESATGKTTFKAWIEPKNVSGDTPFAISTDNETGKVDENGVLTFEGAGEIDVTPLSDADGVLHIEMTEGDETITEEYDIEVVGKHDCHGSEWVTIADPDDENSGYRIMYCDECGDVVSVDSFELCSEHKYGEYELVKDATTRDNGLSVRTCSDCGHEEYKLVPYLAETTTAYSGKLTVELCEDDDTITFVVSPVNGAALPDISAYNAAYSATGVLSEVKMESVLTDTDKNLVISCKKPDGIYKLMLWDGQKPIIKAIEWGN